jgi:hypothetical protein
MFIKLVVSFALTSFLPFPPPIILFFKKNAILRSKSGNERFGLLLSPALNWLSPQLDFYCLFNMLYRETLVSACSFGDCELASILRF